MIQIVVDDSIKSQFLRAGETCEIVDTAGNKLGKFTPQSVGNECPYSDEELRNAAAEGGGRPLDEILADLESQK
jgi:hypothetical protein